MDDHAVGTKRFQSTPPVKAATIFDSFIFYLITISIHAAREGGDAEPHPDDEAGQEFQSTPPVKAATDAFLLRVGRFIKFQSTPPVKAATSDTVNTAIGKLISIHAAREGGDSGRAYQWAVVLHFNPRRP